MQQKRNQHAKKHNQNNSLWPKSPYKQKFVYMCKHVAWVIQGRGMAPNPDLVELRRHLSRHALDEFLPCLLAHHHDYRFTNGDVSACAIAGSERSSLLQCMITTATARACFAPRARGASITLARQSESPLPFQELNLQVFQTSSMVRSRRGCKIFNFFKFEVALKFEHCHDSKDF